MTEKQRQTKETKARPLKVFQVAEGHFLVESAAGKTCYKVRINGDRLCTCDDFAENSPNDQDFACKHILAVMNANGNLQHIGSSDKERMKLDERFIMTIQGREFVKYAGILDLAHQKGLAKLVVEPIQYPTKENGSEAICKAVAESVSGEMFVDIGDANPTNTNKMIASHIIRMASTRAKARVLRDMTNIGMTCLEELGDLDDVAGDESGNGKAGARKGAKTTKPQSQPTPPNPAEQSSKKHGKPSNGKPPEAASNGNGGNGENSGASESRCGVPIFQAQIKAIENLAKRRSLTPEDLAELVQQQYGYTLENLTSSEASSLISYLQKSA